MVVLVGTLDELEILSKPKKEVGKESALLIKVDFAFQNSIGDNRKVIGNHSSVFITGARDGIPIIKVKGLGLELQLGIDGNREIEVMNPLGQHGKR